MQDYFEVGQIVNTFGIKGFLKVVPFTDNIKRFDKLKTVYVKNKNERTLYEIEEVKYHKNMVLLKFKGINTKEEAEKLKTLYLIISRADAVKLPEDTYFIVDLIGLDVFLQDGSYVGKVEDVFSTKSNDVYVVRSEEGKQILIPAIASIVKKVDIENEKRITIEKMEGLY